MGDDSKFRVAIQTVGQGSSDPCLSRRSQESIADSLSEECVIHWLPPIFRQDTSTHGFSVTSALLLFLSGVVFSSIAKPFVESIATEAGKDFWSMIKRLVSQVWKAQGEESYRVEGQAYVIIPLGEEYVAIHIPLPLSDDSRDEIGKSIDKYFAVLSGSWEECQEIIRRFQLGKQRTYVDSLPVTMVTNAEDNVVHLLKEHEDGKISLVPVPMKSLLSVRGSI